MKALSNQSKQDYQTPPWVVRCAEKIWGGVFVLDAAARANNTVCNRYICPPDYILPEAPRHECIGSDALADSTHWNGKLVWCNPPFAKPGPWIEKARQEVDAGNANRVVMLLPASTSTRWFYDEAVEKADEIIFLTPRVSYIGGNGSPAFGSMFLAFHKNYGEQHVGFCDLKKIAEIFGVQIDN